MLVLLVSLLASLLVTPHAVAASSATEQRLASTLLSEAVALEYGELTAKNQLKAAELYCKSARLGNAEASFRLGWMYANGRGVPQDDGIAVALIQRAGDQGYDVPDRLLKFLQTSNVRLPDCLQTSVAQTANKATARVALAAAPMVKPAETGDDGGARNDVAAAINDWAKAWSSKNVADYFAAYAPGFRAASGKSRAEWEADRRARILGKSKIAVSVDQLQIRVEGATAKARFRQHYLADQLDQKSLKLLVLVQTGGKWLIQEEFADAGQKPGDSPGPIPGPKRQVMAER
jgi:Sel1 repeat